MSSPFFATTDESTILPLEGILSDIIYCKAAASFVVVLLEGCGLYDMIGCAQGTGVSTFCAR